MSTLFEPDGAEFSDVDARQFYGTAKPNSNALGILGRATIFSPDSESWTMEGYRAAKGITERMGQRQMSDDEFASHAERNNDRLLSPDEYKASPYYVPKVKWDKYMTESRAKDLYDEHFLREQRSYWDSNTNQLLAFGGAMLGGFADPVGWAAVPIGGPLLRGVAGGAAKVAAMGAGRQFAARAGAAAIDNAAMIAAFEGGLQMFHRRHRGTELSTKEFLYQVGVGAALGAGIRSGVDGFNALRGVRDQIQTNRAPEATVAQENVSQPTTSPNTPMKRNDVAEDSPEIFGNLSEAEYRQAAEATLLAEDPRLPVAEVLDPLDNFRGTGVFEESATSVAARTKRLESFVENVNRQRREDRADIIEPGTEEFQRIVDAAVERIMPEESRAYRDALAKEAEAGEAYVRAEQDKAPAKEQAALKKAWDAAGKAADDALTEDLAKAQRDVEQKIRDSNEQFEETGTHNLENHILPPDLTFDPGMTARFPWQNAPGAKPEGGDPVKPEQKEAVKEFGDGTLETWAKNNDIDLETANIGDYETLLNDMEGADAETLDALNARILEIQAMKEMAATVARSEECRL